MANTPSPKTSQSERFKALAQEVGADTSMEAFDKAVRKVAKAPATGRKAAKTTKEKP
jgi:hypothetical protein